MVCVFPGLVCGVASEIAWVLSWHWYLCTAVRFSGFQSFGAFCSSLDFTAESAEPRCGSFFQPFAAKVAAHFDGGTNPRQNVDKVQQPLTSMHLKVITTMTRLVQCIKLGTQAEGLDLPPYPGPLGKRLWEEVSKQAWADWMKQQTMLVNENRLNLADQRARQYLARQMESHFFGTGADVVQGYTPPAA